MEVPAFAMLSGLGGTNVSLNDTDVNFMTSNPALGGESLNQNLSLNYILYPGDIKISNLTYVRSHQSSTASIWFSSSG